MRRHARPSADALWDDLLNAHRVTAVTPAEYPVHRPDVAVLCCSDARVPPSVVFNQPPGSIFVVRNAGHASGPEALASLDYAVAELGVSLIVVMGHTDCGVAQAAVAGGGPAFVEPLTGPLHDLVQIYPDAGVNEIVELNVLRTVDLLADHPGPTGRALRNRSVELRGAVFDLRSGQLEPLGTDLLDDER